MVSFHFVVSESFCRSPWTSGHASRQSNPLRSLDFASNLALKRGKSRIIENAMHAASKDVSADSLQKASCKQTMFPGVDSYGRGLGS